MNNNRKNLEMVKDYYPLFKTSERIRDLQLLEEIEQNPKVSQRELSHKFGIALGVINACIKRMARRGLIRLRGFPPRRIAYYLTTKGFSEKTKLALHFFSYNIHHYAAMKKQISKKLLEMQDSGVRRVAFLGLSDETEVAYLTFQGLDMKLVGIVDDEERNWGKNFFDYKVIGPKDVKTLNSDAILIFSNKDRNSFVKALAKQRNWDSIKIFTI